MAIAGLARASVRAGLEVAVLSIHGYDETPVPGPVPASNGNGWHAQTEPCGVQVLRIPQQESMGAGLEFALRWRPDVVHTHYIGDRFQADTIRRKTGAPVVFTVHSLDRILFEIDPLVFRHREENMRTEEDAIRDCDLVIALTPDAQRRIPRILPEVSGRVRLGSHGIDDNLETRRQAFSRRPRQPPTVLYCGRFDSNKATSDLFKAIPLIVDRCPETRFVLVGGDSYDPSLAWIWKQKFIESTPRRYHGAVCFTGWLEAAEVAHWYQKADILAVPSWYEMFGVVVLEGMLHGLAVTAADAGGPAEVLQHGHTGLLYPPGDVDALAQSLARLIEDPPLRNRIALAGARQVRHRWLWPRIVGETQGAYQELALQPQ